VIDVALLYVFSFIIFALFAVFLMLGASSSEIPFSKRMMRLEFQHFLFLLVGGTTHLRSVNVLH
jgi:hypothetical protein